MAASGQDLDKANDKRISEILAVIPELDSIEKMLLAYEERIRAKSVSDKHHIKMGQELRVEFKKLMEVIAIQWPDSSKEPGIAGWLVINNANREFLKFLNDSSKLFNTDVKVRLAKKEVSYSKLILDTRARFSEFTLSVADKIAKGIQYGSADVLEEKTTHEVETLKTVHKSELDKITHQLEGLHKDFQVQQQKQQDEIKQLHTTIRRQESEIERLTKVESNIDTMTLAVFAMAGERNQSLRAETASQKKEIEALKKELESSKDKTTMLNQQKEIEALKAQLRDEKKQTEKTEKEYKNMAQDYSAKLKAIMDRQPKELTEKVENAKVEVAATLSGVIERQRAAFDEEIEGLTKQLHEARKEASSLREANAEQQAFLDERGISMLVANQKDLEKSLEEVKEAFAILSGATTTILTKARSAKNLPPIVKATKDTDVKTSELEALVAVEGGAVKSELEQAEAAEKIAASFKMPSRKVAVRFFEQTDQEVELKKDEKLKSKQSPSSSDTESTDSIALDSPRKND